MMRFAPITSTGIGTFAELEASQKFLDNCCWGFFYHGYLTSECSDYIAANKANFGEYEPCAYAASPQRAAGLTPQQIAANDTNAGPALTQASRDEATRMAQEAVAADIANHPDLYSDLCPSGTVPSPIDGSCIPCPKGQVPSGGVCVTPFDWATFAKWSLVVVGIFGAVYLIGTVKR